MTLEGCVRRDAVHVIAAWSLLTALTIGGCTSSAPKPEVTPPPAAVTRVPALRVGVPSPGRWNLLFTCEAPVSAPRIGSAAYAADSLDPKARQWRRIEQSFSDSAGALAPDTLVVVPFDEATDEEIALERGEVDVAVFWPGELSARIRSDARFRDAERGLRSRGVFAAVALAGDTLGVAQADLDALN